MKTVLSLATHSSAGRKRVPGLRIAGQLPELKASGPLARHLGLLIQVNLPRAFRPYPLLLAPQTLIARGGYPREVPHANSNTLDHRRDR
jgi:hypothetical protein